MDKLPRKVCIVGMGYVGLTLAVAMAKRGFNVHGVEIDEKKLNLFKKKKSHFFEKGLESELGYVIDNGNLTFSKIIPCNSYPIYIITVGTPLGQCKTELRLDMIKSVTKEIVEVMDSDSIVILRSTVAVGTTRNVILPILNKKFKSPKIAFCSERTLEGKAMEEILTLPQIIGALDKDSMEFAVSIFQKLAPKIVKVSSIETAEIIKLLDNVTRDIQFGVANEIAEICEHLNINAYEAIQAANLGYTRTNIALPGYVAGPCLEKDSYILDYSLRDTSFKQSIFLNVRMLHERLQARIADRILKWTLKNNLLINKTNVCLLGMAFKGSPETDDLRGAPSITMIDELKKRNYTNIYGHDFLVSDNQIRNLGVTPIDIPGGLNGMHVALFMNNHPSYGKLILPEFVQKMARPTYFFDSWNMFDKDIIDALDDIDYGSIGVI